MTDHADTVREGLRRMSDGALYVAALDALVAERDEARAERDHWSEEALADRARTAEARVTVLTVLLLRLREWDHMASGGDYPMRKAVAAAYKELTGKDDVFLFSGWGAELTEPERAVVENRLPARYDDKGYSEETCVRCGWTMGSPPLNCQNDDTPHRFPSQEALADRTANPLREQIRQHDHASLRSYRGNEWRVHAASTNRRCSRHEGGRMSEHAEIVRDMADEIVRLVAERDEALERIEEWKEAQIASNDATHDWKARVAVLTAALAPFLAQPRWLSIGSEHNTAEIRVSRAVYDCACAALAATKEEGE